jgi:hypothetical protein
MPDQILSGIGQADAIPTIAHPAPLDGDGLFCHVIEVGGQ